MRLGDRPATADVAAIPTGSLALDIASASAASRAAASSRSTARSRRARPRSRSTSSPRRRQPAASAAFIDAEHALDPEYAQAWASISTTCSCRSPTMASRRSRSPRCSIRSGAIDVVAIDSVAALVPRAEIEGEMGDSFVGLQARLMSQALRKLAGTLNNPRPRYLHQPAAREDRRHVRQPRDHHRRPARSSSTPPSGSTSAASRPSRTAPRRSATACASRS